MQHHLLITYITETIIALQSGHLNVARKKLLRVIKSTAGAPAALEVVEWVGDRLLRESMPIDTPDELSIALNRLQSLYDGRNEDLVMLLEFLESKYFNRCMYKHAELMNKRLSTMDHAPKKARMQMLASTYSAQGREAEAVNLLRFAQCMTFSQ